MFPLKLQKHKSDPDPLLYEWEIGLEGWTNLSYFSGEPELEPRGPGSWKAQIYTKPLIKVYSNWDFGDSFFPLSTLLS